MAEICMRIRCSTQTWPQRILFGEYCMSDAPDTMPPSIFRRSNQFASVSATPFARINRRLSVGLLRCVRMHACMHAWVGGRNVATLGGDAFPAVKATHRSFCLHHSIILSQSVYCQPIYRAFTDACHSREGDIQLLHMIGMVSLQLLMTSILYQLITC